MPRNEGSSAVDVLDDPDGGEQRGGEPSRRPVARRLDPVEQPHGAGRRGGAGGSRVTAATRPRRHGGGPARGRDQRGAPVAAGAVEQARGLRQVRRDRGAQPRAQRGRERQLVAGLRAQRVGQRGGAARRAGVGAHELVDLRELCADARGLAARGLGAALELAPGAAGALRGGVRLAAGGRGALGRLAQARGLARGRRPALLELGDLLRHALRAVLGELRELGLERGDAFRGALVARVLLGLGGQRLERRRGGARRARPAS